TGLIRRDDLAAYETRLEKPATVSYRGFDVHKCGPWTQGPVFLQQLRLLEGFDLLSLGHNSAEYVHTLVEAGKLAFADRERWYGTPLSPPFRSSGWCPGNSPPPGQAWLIPIGRPAESGRAAAVRSSWRRSPRVLGA